MPIHTIASAFGDISTSQLIAGATTFAVIFWIKLWSGGKKCSWEREWAGKMILVVVRCLFIKKYKKKKIHNAFGGLY